MPAKTPVARLYARPFRGLTRCRPGAEHGPPPASGRHNRQDPPMQRRAPRLASILLSLLVLLGLWALVVIRPPDTSLPATPAPSAPAEEARLSAWVTGYTFWDNTPPGSAVIARPVLHDEAGGTGTWDDPVTLAVGFTGETWHYLPGTRVYLPELRKYAVVEDLCGSCGKGYDGLPHVDLYIGGAEISAGDADACARAITAVQDILLHPAPDYPVHPGEVAKSGCRRF